MERDAVIFLAGATGLVGSAVGRALAARGHRNILQPTRAGLDLTNQAAVGEYFARYRPHYVLHCAGRVGGIQANSRYGADFIRDNLLMGVNLVEASQKYGVRKILVLGSSCVYPRLAPQPMGEESVMGGPLEPTNEPYAMAKLAVMSMARAYQAQHGLQVALAIGANAYGPGDNFELETSHVIPALMRRFHEAKLRGESEVSIWGSGKPVREFIFSDDLAEGLLFLVDREGSVGPVNVGTGERTTVSALARKIAQTVGYEGRIVQDASKPDGMPEKVLDVSLISGMGWKPMNDLASGLRKTFDWFRTEGATRRAAPRGAAA